jgi:hypothetical protein
MDVEYEQYRAWEYAELYNLVTIWKSCAPTRQISVDPVAAARAALQHHDQRLLEPARGLLTENDIMPAAWKVVGSKSVRSVFAEEPQPGDDVWIGAAIYNLIIMRSLPGDVRFAR